MSSRSARLRPSLQSDCNCTVIDLRSRHVAADEARRRIAASTSAAHRVHKIDSTLRGNWSAELTALVGAGRRVVMIPSHPRAGRVCVRGVVYVNGVPVAESELGNDPRLPVRSSRPSDSLTGTEVAVYRGGRAGRARRMAGDVRQRGCDRRRHDAGGDRRARRDRVASGGCRAVGSGVGRRGRRQAPGSERRLRRPSRSVAAQRRSWSSVPACIR